MKTYKNILFSTLLVFSLFSCSDWFEVEPENEIAKEDLFSTYDGYRTALNGIYRNMVSQELYGRELTWATVSLLGQNYQSSSFLIPSAYQYLITYEYDQADVKSLFQTIWNKAYNTIANCNILIQYAESQSADFFYEAEVEKDVLIGEAKGLRALMHFDLLRLFAPAPVTGDNGAYIPYVSHYLTSHPTHLSTEVVLDSIINDLKQAQRLLAYNDTLYNVTMMQSAQYRFHDNVTDGANGGSFFAFRGCRMNYVAATALLARAYLYKGDKENAYQYAAEAWRYQDELGWYQFTAASNIENENVDYRHAKMYDDILLAFSSTETTKNYEDWLNNQYLYSGLLLNNTADLFGTDMDDFRYSQLIYNGVSLKWEAVVMDPNMSWMNSDIINYELPLCPVIRMSEVVYIMCEYLADTDLPRAIELLEMIRVARGCKTPLNTSMSRDAFLEALYNDETREFLAEGQTFYLYKRLNRDMYNGAYPIDMDGKYIVPLPDSETSIQ